MRPTALSEVIEALSKLTIGVFAAWFIIRLPLGVPIAYLSDFVASAADGLTEQLRLDFASAGALFGVTAGILLSLIAMMTIYTFYKKKKVRLDNIPIRPRQEIVKELIFIAIPITIGAAVTSLASLIDLFTVINRLQVNPAVMEPYSHVFAEGASVYRQATALYGMYTGYAFPMFNIPLAIVVALSASLVPAIAGAMAKNEPDKASKITHTVIRFVLLFTLPAAVGMSLLAGPILHLIYNNANAAGVLQLLALAIVFVALVLVTNAILQAYGKVFVPVCTMLIGGAAKVAINYFLIPVWGISAAPISTIVCYAIIVLLNIFFIAKYVKLSFNFTKTFISPALSSIIMGVAALFSHDILSRIMPQRIATVGAIAVAGVIYLFLILITRAVDREDLEMIPFLGKLSIKIYRWRA